MMATEQSHENDMRHEIMIINDSLGVSVWQKCQSLRYATGLVWLEDELRSLLQARGVAEAVNVKTRSR